MAVPWEGGPASATLREVEGICLVEIETLPFSTYTESQVHESIIQIIWYWLILGIKNCMSFLYDDPSTAKKEDDTTYL